MAVSLDKTGYTLPDAELFKIRFPVFSAVGDTRLDFMIDEVEDTDPTRWVAKDFQMAIMYLVAHRLTLEGEPERSDALALAAGDPTGGAVAGTVKKVKVGDVETTFMDGTGSKTDLGNNAAGDDPTSDDLNYQRTQYGREYLRLRRKSFGGPRVFC